QGPISLKSIAQRQLVSEHYLEQLMAALRKAGLVKSKRGAYGGYQLAYPPEEIGLGDIIRILEGPITPLDCLGTNGGDGPYCHQPECVLRNLWSSLQKSMESVLDSTTLETLRQDALKLGVNDRE
ncbi:MAG: Rrf2 family transcriptional regulator, partial [Firmicutes bacterium]|nr:Rrf2 family transcriptional regulator [Bacillota bacterium]